MANPDFIKNYNAEAAISAYLIVKPGSNPGGVTVAAAATDKLMGVNQHLDVGSGQPIDVVHEGIANVKAGGTVNYGDPITSDANGKGVVAAPSAGSNVRIIGFALSGAASGDVFPVLLSLGVMQG